MYLIGIDPGVNTGIAVWDTKGRRFLVIDTVKIHKAMHIVDTFCSGGDGVKVVVEDARARKWFARERSVSEYRGKMMGAGSVKRDCKIWEDFLADRQKDGLIMGYELRSPQPGLTKWGPEEFRKYTGVRERTSNHARDAAMLVFGAR